MAEKNKIFYSRTYRRLKVDKRRTTLYLLLVIIPSLIVLLFNLSNISTLMTNLGVKVLDKYIPEAPIGIATDEVLPLLTLKYIEIETVYPSTSFVFLNLIVIIGVLLFVASGKRKSNIVSIFFIMITSIHLINCIYFIFSPKYFPYDALQYSELYMKQQVGIWIIFIILSGLITGFLGNIGLKYKLIAFFTTFIYSFIFGILRYVLFLFIIQKFSILYMAPMFFIFGPFFDFLYLVAIYSILANKMVELYDSKDGRVEWLWS